MNEWEAAVGAHLTTAPGVAWRWQDDGSVLAWEYDGTIAFRQEIEAIYTRVGRELRVVPPLGAIALLVAAVRANPRGALGGSLVARLGRSVAKIVPVMPAPPLPPDSVAECAVALQLVAQVPQSFWKRMDALEVLASAVFENAGLVPDAAAVDHLVEAFRRGIGPRNCRPRDPVRAGDDWRRALEALRLGLSRFDPTTLELRARTSLPSLPVAAPIELADAGGVRTLIAALRDDPELSTISRMARDLLAAIHWPRGLKPSRDLPVGGYSDISNRGPIDRLLVSELAHDDATLATRIVLREALYTRREAPRVPPKGVRLILVDCGIRMWGAPRAIAASVALALAAEAGPGRRAGVWRAAGAEIVPVDLTARAGLIDLLEALFPDPHPGPSLPAFLARVRDADAAREVFLITHAAVMRDPAFVQPLSAVRAEGVNVAMLSDDGRVTIDALSALGSRRVHESLLDVSGIGRETPAAADARRAFDDPAIFLSQPFPLRVAHGVAGSRRFVNRLGTFALTFANQLVTFWDRDGLGARILAELPPRKMGLLIEATDKGIVHVVRGDGGGQPIDWFIYDLESGESTTRTVVHGLHSVRGVFRQDGVLFVVGPNAVRGFTDFTGDAVTIDGLPSSAELEWWGCRYFRIAQRHFVMRSDESRAWLEPVQIPVSADGWPAGTFWLFDRRMTEGPSVLTLVPFAVGALRTGERARFPGSEAPSDVRWIHASADGHRLMLNGDRVYEIGVGFARGISRGDHFTALEPSSSWKEPEGSILRTLAAIGVTRDGDLALKAVRGDEWLINVTSRALGVDPHVVHMREMPRGCGAIRWVPLSRVVDHPWITARTAPSEAVVAMQDRRGMIHLRRAMGGAPEVTIVPVRNARIAVWSSSGVLHGPKYFLGDRDGCDSGAARACIRDVLGGIA